MICPFCGQSNIEGVDLCQHCEQALFGSQSPPMSPIEQGLLEDPVIGIATAPPIIVSPDRKVGEVLELLVQHAIGCVIVANKDQPVGMFSERDALLRLGADIDTLRGEPVHRFMSTPVECLPADAPIAFALQKMNVGGYRHLPILCEARVVGVVSIRDILQYLATQLLPVESS